MSYMTHLDNDGIACSFDKYAAKRRVRCQVSEGVREPREVSNELSGLLESRLWEEDLDVHGHRVCWLQFSSNLTFLEL